MELHEKKRLLSQKQRNLNDTMAEQSKEYNKQIKDIEITKSELAELERAQARFEGLPPHSLTFYRSCTNTNVNGTVVSRSD